MNERGLSQRSNDSLSVEVQWMGLRQLAKCV